MSEPLIQEIYLNKLKNNALKIKKLIGNKVKLCAVVKSDGYGHGVCKISSSLYSICDYFAISLLEEAVALRFSGIDKPILMLTPTTKNTVNKLINYDITLSVSTFNELFLIDKTAKFLNKKAKVHIALNTGMNRLGFDSLKSVIKCVEFIKKSKNIILEGAFSHFGNVENEILTESAYKKFMQLSKPIKNYNKSAILHISASGGLLKDKKYHLSMVRVGLLLYGYKPFETNKISVEPIMIIKAKNLIKRNGVLNKHLMYGETLSNSDKVTLLRLGYADGFNVNGVLNSENKLCMDLCAISGEYDSEYVCVLNNAEVFAKKWNTNIYDVLVSVSKRTNRIYY